MRDKARWLVVCREMPEHFQSVWEYTDYTRSHHHPGAQFWVGSSRNWSVMYLAISKEKRSRHSESTDTSTETTLNTVQGLHHISEILEHRRGQQNVHRITTIQAEQ